MVLAVSVNANFVLDYRNGDYAQSYVRLSLLGVNNINNLTECSRALPVARPDFLGFALKFVNG